ncbi:hypothetical protein [Chryseobacterium sp. Leaf201]|uniref:hypothetical protein n=1 Tax=Chryseobacterium sp. Leaf201 TaxID=1735672 RepID=UPI001EE6E93F|nr:hypothetical protein [Chryseobacterium sp. Leaf201]
MKWLISVSQGSIHKVTESLEKKGVKVLDVLEMINVIIVEPDNSLVSEIKAIEGVENVEEERNINI